MSVVVRLFAAARAAAGVESTTVGAGTLAGICAELQDGFPAITEVLPRCSFLIDGIAVHGDARDVHVASGSEVDVLPPFAGG